MPKRAEPAARVDARLGLDALLGYHVRRASTAMMAALAADLSPIALTVVEASVLLAIVETPGATQSEVGSQLDIHRANMAPIAAKLEERRLIVRQPGQGRATRLTATAQGERVASDAMRILKAHDARYLSELGARDRERLLGWLRRIWFER